MKHKSILFSLAFLLSLPVLSQEPVELSLADAQALTLQHNRMLKNASLEVQSADLSRWQALASMLPQANVTFDYSNFFGYKLSFGPGMEIPMNPSGNFTGQVALALSGAQIVGTQLAAIAARMAEIGLQKTNQEISNQVKTIYYSILIMDETVSLLESNRDNIKKLHESTLSAVQVGVADQTAADQLLVQLSTMETTINTTKRSLEMLYNSLRFQMGVEGDTPITLTQSVDELLRIGSALELLNADFYIDNNYGYQLMKQAANLSEKQISLNAWSYGPTVSTFYQYTKKTYFGKDEGFNMTPPNLIGASISLPIFSSGIKYTKVMEAKIKHEEQLNTLADTKEGLLIQHKQLRYNLSSAVENYETQKQSVEVNQRILDNISKKYEQGMSSSLDVTTTGTNLIAAQNGYVRAVMEVVSAQIALEELLNINN